MLATCNDSLQGLPRCTGRTARADRRPSIMEFAPGMTSLAAPSFALPLPSNHLERAARMRLAPGMPPPPVQPILANGGFESGSTGRTATLDLTRRLGKTATIRFSGTEDSSRQTSFVLDDIAITLR
jgi:hypothetical protein